MRSTEHSKEYTKEEREVILNISDADDEWTAYVSSPKMMKKFEKANWECIRVDRDSQGLIAAKTFKASFNQIAIKDKRKKRELSPEELEILRQRAKAMQKSKK